MNLIERLEDGAIPPRIDRTFLGTMSGGYQTQIIAALRALDFIDDDGTVLPTLIEFVHATPDDRKPILSRILKSKYATAVKLGEWKGTQGQLEEAFDAYGVSGSTKRKAIAFFLKAAEEAGLELSPNFRVPKASPTRRRRRRLKSVGIVAADGGTEEEAIDDGGRHHDDAPSSREIRRTADEPHRAGRAVRRSTPRSARRATRFRERGGRLEKKKPRSGPRGA